MTVKCCNQKRLDLIPYTLLWVTLCNGLIILSYEYLYLVKLSFHFQEGPYIAEISCVSS